MSIPFTCRMATTQDAAASPSVAVSAAAVAAVLALVMAAEREVHQRVSELDGSFDAIRYGHERPFHV